MWTPERWREHERGQDGRTAAGIYAAVVLGVALLALLFWATGCTVPAAWVEADRRTHDCLAPEYRAYVDRDPALTEEQRERRRRVLDAWRRRLEEFER